MEILIQNVNIMDGSGAPAYVGSIGIDHGKLNVFRDEAPQNASEIMDGTGLTAVPGFIDAHSHGDINEVSVYPTASKITQGITTQVAGQCGYSMFPCNGADLGTYKKFISSVSTYPDFPDNLAVNCANAASWFRWVESLSNPVTTKAFVGHGTLRLWAMGYENRKPTEYELAKMQDMLRLCMHQGALGLSTGLVYSPCCYADDEEILALLKVVREEGGFYATHPRNEADQTVEAVTLSVMTARKAEVPLCVSHLKAAGRKNWGKPHRILELIRESREKYGQRIMMDCYPYMAGNTALNVSIPPRYFKNGLTGLVAALSDPKERAVIREEMERVSDYENYVTNCGGFSGVYVSSSPVFHDAEGMFISEYAEKTGQDPFDAFCDILIQNGGLSLAIYFHMCEDDVTEILSDPWTAIGTDGLLGLPKDNPHPRTFGTMPRAYNMLVNEKKLYTPEQAIHKMTGMPAEFLKLKGKGYIKDGMDADILLLDLGNFHDTSTYQHGSARANGIHTIITHGKIINMEKYL